MIICFIANSYFPFSRQIFIAVPSADTTCASLVLLAEVSPQALFAKDHGDLCNFLDDQVQACSGNIERVS